MRTLEHDLIRSALRIIHKSLNNGATYTVALVDDAVATAVLAAQKRRGVVITLSSRLAVSNHLLREFNYFKITRDQLGKD